MELCTNIYEIMMEATCMLIHIFKGEIYDYSIKDISKAINIYLEFLDLYPNSIYYDERRLRLRDLAS